MSKRILIVATYYPPNVIGGAEIVAHRQARQLRERGYSVSAFTRDRRVEHSSNADIVDDIKVARFLPSEFSLKIILLSQGLSTNLRRFSIKSAGYCPFS